jgi:hypothetical protein
MWVAALEDALVQARGGVGAFGPLEELVDELGWPQ